MTKNEIISEVVSTTNLTRSQATKAYDAIFKSIKKSLRLLKQGKGYLTYMETRFLFQLVPLQGLNSAWNLRNK